MKFSYNWLQNYFEEKLPTPEDISEGIIFHSFEVDEMDKVENDTVFDIKILPDRAHDCLSHWGIAKEISAIFDLKIKDKVYKNFENKYTNLNIQIQDEKCLRYMGRVVRNIKVGESPTWLKEKLNAIGQKSINNIVDAANFVMFDLGQPIHCFDLDKLASEKLIIRNGKIGEIITTLDKKEVKLDDSILVIADEKYPLAIAGIKGGTRAEVDNNTKNIVIEVANFNPTTTRKTSKKINIQTDAVKRYENEIPPELCSVTMDAITDMIYSLAGGEVENIVDVYSKKADQRIIETNIEYINKRLGSNFSREEIESVWRKLKFIYEENNGEYKIQVPFLRLDLTGPHDLTEEVIRVMGYDKLVEKLPEIKINDSKTNNIYHKMLLTRERLLNDGYSEVMTYSFRDKGDVEVLASAMGKNFLRNNISDGLKESIKLNTLNLPLLDMKEVKVFEIGTVFSKGGEVMNVAYGDKKNVIEMSLDKFLSIETLPKDVSKQGLGEQKFTNKNSFKMWSNYPFITRDIAVWVPNEVESDKLYKVIKENAGELLIKNPYLFDSFTKGEKTSYAYRLVFQSYDKTLTDEEINPIMGKITEKISSLGWEVR
ncbi:MAG: phenylalanine--tRNA ligase subunit beta [Candidatus Paceibacterota bacterium]|jgi:phenylalanyl-tRNA synthetase beta chain